MILREGKRIYPGIIDDLFVAENFSGYAYCRVDGERYISIYPECDDKLFETGSKIVRYVNKEFNSQFKQNLKTISIVAFCHEIGHAIDFEMHKMLGDDEYQEKINKEFVSYYSDAMEYYEEYDEFVEYANEKELELDDASLVEWKCNLERKENEIDYKYRRVSSEYAADEFSAFFMNTYMRHISQLFE
jgi:hypothetical protein